MTREQLVELSQIKVGPNFSDIDYAVPITSDGSYPEAVSIYWKNGQVSLVSIYKLKTMALDYLNAELRKAFDLKSPKAADEYFGKVQDYLQLQIDVN